MKTISDLDNINTRTHGFSRDGIPEAGDTVRIDVFGGFVLQRITKEKSFFRAIANMDIKLDFVPPWLINFMSRQLIGSGHKLYQKAVSTVASCDEDYKKALRAPLYIRIREYQDLVNKAKMTPTEENANEILPENHTVQNLLSVTNITSNSEIVEEESEQNTFSKDHNLLTGPRNQPAEQGQEVENKPFISPEVEQALDILDTSIAVLRGSKTENISKLQDLLSCDATFEDSTVGPKYLQSNLFNSDNLPNGRPATVPTQNSRSCMQRETRETNDLHKKELSRVEDDTDNVILQNSTASTVTKTLSMTLRSTTRVHGEESLNSNVFHENGIHNNKESKRPKKNKRWLCC